MNAASRLAPAPPLTRGQRQILELAAQGHEQSEIARQLGIGRQAVETALLRCRERLGARNTAHLCALAVAAGLVDVQRLLIEHAAAHRAGLYAAGAYR